MMYKYLLALLLLFGVSFSVTVHAEDFVTGFGKAISPVQNAEKQVQAPFQKAIQAPIQKDSAIQKSPIQKALVIRSNKSHRFTPFARLRKAREERAEARAELALVGCG